MHARTAYWEASGIARPIGTSWRWVVRFTPWPLFSLTISSITHWMRGWMGPTSSLSVKRKISYSCLELNPKCSLATLTTLVSWLYYTYGDYPWVLWGGHQSLFLYEMNWVDCWLDLLVHLHSVLLHGDNLTDHAQAVPCPTVVYPERYYQSLEYVVLGDTLVKVETQTLCLENV